MGKKEQSIYDIVEYAKKYSVKDAALAYSVSQASVYRYLSIRISEKSNKEATQHLQPEVLLDFKSHLLIPEKIHRKKLIPGLYLLTAYDVNQNNFYYALSSENNKSNTQYFLNYLYNKINLCNPDIIINNCYNEPNTSYKSNRKWQIPVEIVTSLTDSIAHSKQTDLQAVIFGNQILNNSPEILPITITAASINEFNRYLNKDQFWQKTNINAPELFLKSCEYLVNRAGELFIKGEIEKAMAIAEKVVNQNDIRFKTEDFNKLFYKAFLLLAKANKLKFNHIIAIDYYNKAIQVFPELGEAYYQFSVFYYSIGKKDDAEKYLILAQNSYRESDLPEARCKYYETLGKFHYQHKSNLHSALINFKKMKETAESISNHDLIFEANGYIANLYYVKQSYDLAEELYLENVEISFKKHDKMKQALVMYNLALLKTNTGNYEQAEKYILNSLVISHKIHDFNKTMLSQIAYAEILLYQEKYQKSIKMYNDAIELYIKPSKNLKLLLDAYNSVASIYKKQNLLKKAIRFFKMALIVETQTKSSSYKPYICNQLAEIYTQKNEKDKATTLYKKVFKLTNDKKELREIRAYSAFNLGKILTQEKHFKRASEYLAESDSIFKILHLHTGFERYKVLRNEISLFLVDK